MDLSTVFQTSGVARPWRVIRYNAMVHWSPASNSVQSTATRISSRPASSYFTHASNMVQVLNLLFAKSRSICLMACLGSLASDHAKARPMTWIDSVTAATRLPTPISAKESFWHAGQIAGFLPGIFLSRQGSSPISIFLPPLSQRVAFRGPLGWRSVWTDCNSFSSPWWM